MKTYIAVLASLLTSLNLQGYSNFVANPGTPYPPGCATLPELQTGLYGDNMVKVFDQRIPLVIDSERYETRDANLAVYRVGCAEANRSVIWLVFSTPYNVDPQTIYRLPRIHAELSGDPFAPVPMTPVREPNTWQIGFASGNDEQTFGGPPDIHGASGYDRQWIYLLENTEGYYLNYSVLNYNDSFKLVISIPTFQEDLETVVDIPSTADSLHANPRIPLNGRLSGNWVVDGTSDQGFVLEVSEMVEALPQTPERLRHTPLLMFLSWYTFDAEGGLLWFTGTAQFAMGATQVSIPIERVTGGEFLGRNNANREVVGNVIIVGNNCNDLRFEYDLTGIGLGSGSKRLQRLFSLETAGYTCRDLEARIQAK